MAIDKIEINVAAMDYDRDKQVLTRALREIEALVHEKDDFVIGDPQFTFGWYFFTLTVHRELLVKLANLLGNDFLSVKGKSFEKKFVIWLAGRLKRLGSNMKLELRSEIESSKYGLF
jgi:hypothetical protein